MEGFSCHMRDGTMLVGLASAELEEIMIGGDKMPESQLGNEAEVNAHRDRGGCFPIAVATCPE